MKKRFWTISAVHGIKVSLFGSAASCGAHRYRFPVNPEHRCVAVTSESLLWRVSQLTGVLARLRLVFDPQLASVSFSSYATASASPSPYAAKPTLSFSLYMWIHNAVRMIPSHVFMPENTNTYTKKRGDGAFSRNEDLDHFYSRQPHIHLGYSNYNPHKIYVYILSQNSALLTWCRHSLTADKTGRIHEVREIFLEIYVRLSVQTTKHRIGFYSIA